MNIVLRNRRNKVKLEISGSVQILEEDYGKIDTDIKINFLI